MTSLNATICRCGLAESYHHHTGLTVDHAYEPRYGWENHPDPLRPDPLRAPGTDDDEPWPVYADPPADDLLRNVLAVFAVVLVVVALVRRR